MSSDRGIYVEILVRAPMDALWRHTQTPALHEQWDLRFSRIDYLPKERDSDPQRFRYTTRIGLGLRVNGVGESVGERNSTDGRRSSALKFSSGDSLAIIREGSGYWKYIPTPAGILFLTWYDYRTRYGVVGALFDRLVFRPLIGWATAWSFDRLRLWLEEGIAPVQAMREALVHGVVRVGLALVFAYQGLVPKLIAQHADEITLLRGLGVPDTGNTAVIVLGASELVMAACLLVFWHRRWPPALCLGLVLLATGAVGVSAPRYFEAAFNPFSLNTAVACLAVADLLVVDSMPWAARCRRRPRLEKP
jgi:hypothetical protein